MTHDGSQRQRRFPRHKLALCLVVAMVLLPGCFHEPGGPDEAAPNATGDSVLEIARDIPAEAEVGDPFTVTLTITTERELPLLIVEETYGRLTLEDQGDFGGSSERTLRGVVTGPTSTEPSTLSYRVACPEAGDYHLTATATSNTQDLGEIQDWVGSSVNCVAP